jgi:transposase InsO family protein
VADVREAPPPVSPRRLGRLGQRRQRHDRARQVRQHAVAIAREIAAVGYTQHETAKLLRITDRTLRNWCRKEKLSTVLLCLAGRPAARSTPDARNAVIDYLDEYGPGLGLPPLRAAFPHFTRAELDDLLHRYRRVWRERHRRPLHILNWTTPGAVWAMDYAKAPNTLDGIGRILFAVRDLASGQQLLWQPICAANALATAEMLAMLFVRHGAPLVLKNDNDSAFGAPEVAILLDEFRVTPLFSPPYTPSYNGAIEAGIGSLKDRTDAQAARHGRPGFWTGDDIAAARLEANAYTRPRGLHEPTPDEYWNARSSIPEDQRLSFRHAVEDHRCSVRDKLGLPVGTDSVATHRTVDRAAVRQALVGLGYLQFTRRLIPPVIVHRVFLAVFRAEQGR